MLTLYENIQKYRNLRGMSQEQLAELVGYKDRTSIAKIEAGNVDLSNSKIRKFAEAFEKEYVSQGFNTNRSIGGFKTGLLMQIVNVKVLLLCVSAQSTYIITIDKSQGLKFILVLLIPICCFLCGIVWALAGTIISSFYKKHNKMMNIIFSSSLFLLAIRALFEFFNLLKY